MPTTPHIECWDAIPRDLQNSDRSRFRGETPAPARAAAERTTDLGNGLTRTTYVDHVSPHNPPQA